MKLVNMRLGSTERLGLVTEPGTIHVRKATFQFGCPAPATLSQLMANPEKGLAELEHIATLPSAPLFSEPWSYAPIVPNPGKILCVGLNYHNHTAELNFEVPSNPVLFSKFNNTLAAHQEDIALPATASRYDYEAELVIVMGKTASHVPVEQALDYVLGYTIGNDLTARELQVLSGQWLLGKSLDSFAPIGPYLITKDDIEDPQDLAMQLHVNGVERQNETTARMIFSCAELISYASRYFTLQPGDIIFTGTPGGVISGMPKGQRPWLKPGDDVSVSISGLGTLHNRLV